MMRLIQWPGAFVDGVVAQRSRISPSSVVLSPVLWLSAMISFAFFLPNVGSLIFWTDSGELITSAYTFGIPHPTGYPLFTILSRFVLVLMPFGDTVHILHLLSAGFVALAAGTLSLITILFLRSVLPKSHDRGMMAMMGVMSSLLFSTTVTTWEQAVSYEVYGLQTFLYAIIILSLLIALREMRGRPGAMSSWWVLTGLLVGFGFSNHMMTLYLVPGCLWIIWKHGGRITPRLAAAFLGSAGFGLSMYAYLIIRAHAQPIMNWGDPSTLSSFWVHVTGMQYRVWMFTGTDVFLAKASEFFSSIPRNVGWIAICLFVAGLVGLWKKDRRLLWFAALLLTFTLAYSFNYNIHDIETYFLLVYIVMAVVGATGLAWVVHLFRDRWRDVRRPVYVIPIALVIMNVLYRHDAFIPPDRVSPEPFAADVLGSLGRNAAVVTGQWDFLYSPFLAMQKVRGIRPDVRAIDIHLLRDRSWYVRSMLTRHASEDEDLARKGKTFLEELTKFETGRPVNPQVIRLRWEDFLEAFILKLSSEGPLYVDHGVVGEIPSIFGYQPDGYLLRAISAGDSLSYRGAPQYYPLPQKNAETDQYYRRFVSTVFVHHARFALSTGDSGAARICVAQARLIDGTNPLLRTTP